MIPAFCICHSAAWYSWMSSTVTRRTINSVPEDPLRKVQVWTSRRQLLFKVWHWRLKHFLKILKSWFCRMGWPSHPKSPADDCGRRTRKWGWNYRWLVLYHPLHACFVLERTSRDWMRWKGDGVYDSSADGGQLNKRLHCGSTLLELLDRWEPNNWKYRERQGWER